MSLKGLFAFLKTFEEWLELVASNFINASMCRFIIEWLLETGNSRRWRLVGRNGSLGLGTRSCFFYPYSFPHVSFPSFRHLWCKECYFSAKISCSPDIRPHYIPKVMEPGELWLKHLKSWAQAIIFPIKLFCLFSEKNSLPLFVLQSSSFVLSFLLCQRFMEQKAYHKTLILDFPPSRTQEINLLYYEWPSVTCFVTVAQNRLQ